MILGEICGSVRDVSRRAKIICTLGPSVEDETSLAALIDAGMDAARLNLSFGKLEEHVARLTLLRKIAEEKGKNVAIIADIPGPKLRLGKIENNRCTLVSESTVELVADGEYGNANRLLIDSDFFHSEMIRGDKILLSEGLVELEIIRVEDAVAHARVLSGGDVVQQTGVHVPGQALRDGPITEDDDIYLDFAVKNDVDYLALTYVRDGADVLQARDKLESKGKSIPLIAKIERPEAFARLDGILERADAVMMRRGDLGANIELSRVPTVQKEVIRLANAHGVPVIIATQMLGSMIQSPRPTRAEASDVSNAIIDGADGVMLSAETAIGEYATAALDMMHKIICETEDEMYAADLEPSNLSIPNGFADTTAAMACQAAHQCDASLIACFTASGKTAGLVAKYRPRAPIIAFCQAPQTQRYLALRWGIQSMTLDPVDSAEKMVRLVDEKLLKSKTVKAGDAIVVVYGAPIGEMGHTNAVRLHTVGSPY